MSGNHLFFGELKRRNVVRVGGLCAGARIHLSSTPKMNLRGLFVEFKLPFLISLDGGITA